MIDNKLNFYSHIDVICKKAIQIFSTLSRISPFKQMPKGRLLINAFFMESRFNYCPPVCMLQRNIKNNMSNCRHERCLRITYSDKYSTFGELPEKDNSATIHKRALRFPSIKVFKLLKAFLYLQEMSHFKVMKGIIKI